MKTTIVSIAALLLLIQLNVDAGGSKHKKSTERTFLPNYINLQYAGNLGLGSIGAGYISANEKHQLGINYGYLPSSVNSVKVHTFSLKGALNFRKHKLSEKISANAYLGTHLLYSATKNTYVKFPSYFPPDYYYSNAIHLAPFLGVKISSRTSITRFSYFEVGTLDNYLINRIKYHRNQFVDCINLCMGISIPLNNKPRDRSL
jgi:hypothetical protein